MASISCIVFVSLLVLCAFIANADAQYYGYNSYGYGYPSSYYGGYGGYGNYYGGYGGYGNYYGSGYGYYGKREAGFAPQTTN